MMVELVHKAPYNALSAWFNRIDGYFILSKSGKDLTLPLF